MAVRIANLKILISASTRGLVSGLGKGATAVKTFSGRITRSLKSVTSLTTGLVGLVGVTLGARSAIRSLTDQFAELDKLGKTASKLGLSVEALQKMRFAAKLTGLEVTTVDMALQRWTKNLSKAATGSVELNKVFVELGINAKELTRLPFEEQMLRFADAMEGAATQGDRVRIAAALLDSEGVGLVNTLKGGSEALDAMFRERGELGLFTSEQVRRIEEANDNMTRFGIQVNFIKGVVASELSPVVSQLAADFVNLGKDGEFSIDGLNDALEITAKSMAFIVDALDTARIAAGIFGLQLQLAGIQFQEIIGVTLGFDQKDEANFLGRLKSLREQTVAAIRDLENAWVGPTALDAMDKFFDRVGERAKRTREDSFSRGGLLPDPPSGGGGVKLPAALERGSAAAFSFLAKSGTRGKDLADVVNNGKLQLTALDRVTIILQKILKEQQGKLEGAAL